MGTIKNIYQFVFSEWWWTCLFFFAFFWSIYFVGVAVTNWLINKAVRQHKVNKIVEAIRPGQIGNEIKQSILSIIVFSVQAIFLQILVKYKIAGANFTNAYNLFWQIPVLFFWNEIHFYICHWVLHRKWLFKTVHYKHHISKEPTVFSVFSFHWFEAFLLGTVIFFPMVIYPFHVLALLSLPIMSLILNLLGHCNHEAVNTKGDAANLSRFTFRHSMHHKWSNGNYGFMLPYFDKLFKTNLPKNKY